MALGQYGQRPIKWKKEHGLTIRPTVQDPSGMVREFEKSLECQEKRSHRQQRATEGSRAGIVTSAAWQWGCAGWIREDPGAGK